jgi:hypothetical protein
MDNYKNSESKLEVQNIETLGGAVRILPGMLRLFMFYSPLKTLHTKKTTPMHYQIASQH